MDLKRVLSFPPYPGDYLHPVVYACTAVMLLCLLVSIFTYIVHNRVIRINKNGWHMLLNFLFHAGLTFGVFTGGINQIDTPFVCQMVGILLHYASLSTMLWLMFTARNIYKDVSKDSLKAADRTGTVKAHSKPTILRFYIVSDGFPLLIAGVTAAFDLNNYGSRKGAQYCWMAWEPSLGGFFCPVALVVLVMCVYFMCTFIQLKRHPERKYELCLLSEEQQQTDSRGATGDPLPFSPGISMLANEHSFKSQLRATAFTLFLFLSTWALGALAVTLGHFLDMIFSCLYGAFCVTLGLFLLIQHCAKRDDVWHRWWVCCPSKDKDNGKNGDVLGRGEVVHQPICHISSSCPAPVIQTVFSPPSPTLNHSPQCCGTMLTTDTLQDDLPRPILPLQSCLMDRTKSRSFSRPRPYLQDYRSHFNSTSMDNSFFTAPDPSLLLQRKDSVTSSHSHTHNMADSTTSFHSHGHNMTDSITSCSSLLQPSHSPHACQWHLYGPQEPCSEDMEPYSSTPQNSDKQNRLCVEVEQKHFPRNTLPRQHGTMGRRGPIGRNRSLQEDGLFGSDSTGNIRTGPWKNETTV
ncbi:adhesion G protein-coupled receptor A1-like [Eucyclogobius newberryi]|uniref:adhesion G protein-coupled receptor A1-like n=1 Tax=Eucyclogobius newberryi TaxID=166745 RepID=UPI003B58DD58